MFALLLSSVVEEAESNAEHSADGGHEVSQGIRIVFFSFASILMGSLIRSLFRKLVIPYTVILLLFGMTLGLLVNIFGDSLGIITSSVIDVRSIDPHLLFQVFLPALIFESAFSVHYHTVYRELGQAFLLAGPGVVISAVTTGLVALLFPYDWSLTISLMFGFMLSATDPVAVVALLRELGASKRLGTLIEAESLLNDGTAFVFFILLQERVSGKETTLLQDFGHFAQLSFGGVGLGLLAGIITATWISNIFKDFEVETAITFISSYLTFYIAESELEVSGVLAVVFLGITLAKYRTVVSVQVEHGLHQVWQMVSYIANTMIFIISGIIVTQKFNQNVIALADFGILLLLYISLHIIRTITVLALLPWMNRIGYSLSWKDVIILVYGGLRGAVSLALALLVEMKADDNTMLTKQNAALIVFHTAGIVFLTLTINATTIKPILQRLGLDKQQPAVIRMYDEAMKTINQETSSIFVTLTDDRQFRGADWDAVKRSRPMLHRKKNRKTTKLSLISSDAHTYTAGYLRTSGSQTFHNRSGTISQFHTNEEECTEIRRRYMLGMRTMCFEQHEEGLISSTAVRLLVDAVDEGLDTEDLSGIWNVIEPQFTIPAWSERLYQKSRIFRHLLYRVLLRPRLSLSVELAIGYLNASKRACDNLRDFEDVVKKNAFVTVMRDVLYYEAKTRAKWVQVEVEYPEIYRAIQTRHATDYLMYYQNKRIKHLFHKGLIEEKEFSLMAAIIDQAIYKLHTTQPYLRNARIGEVQAAQDFRHLKIISHLSNEVKDQVAAASELLTFGEGETIFNAGEQCRGLYVIVSGVVEIHTEGSDDDSYVWYGSGSNIGAWPLLTNGRHFETAKANSRTQVNVHLIPPFTVEVLMADHEVESRLWKQVAANLAKRYFRDQFRTSAHIQLTKMCDESTFVKPLALQDVEIKSPCILLLGYVSKGKAPQANHSRMSRRYSLQSHDAQAPVILLPSWYKFSHDAKLLQLPDSLPSDWSSALTSHRTMTTSGLNTIIFPRDPTHRNDGEKTVSRLQAVLSTLREAVPDADIPRGCKLTPSALLQDENDTTKPTEMATISALNLSIFQKLQELHRCDSVAIPGAPWNPKTHRLMRTSSVGTGIGSLVAGRQDSTPRTSSKATRDDTFVNEVRLTIKGENSEFDNMPFAVELGKGLVDSTLPPITDSEATSEDSTRIERSLEILFDLDESEKKSDSADAVDHQC